MASPHRATTNTMAFRSARIHQLVSEPLRSTAMSSSYMEIDHYHQQNQIPHRNSFFSAAPSDFGHRYALPMEERWEWSSSQVTLHHRVVNRIDRQQQLRSTGDLQILTTLPSDGHQPPNFDLLAQHHGYTKGGDGSVMAAANRSRSEVNLVDHNQQCHRQGPAATRSRFENDLIEYGQYHHIQMQDLNKNFRSEDLMEKPCTQQKETLNLQGCEKKMNTIMEIMRSIKLDIAQMKAELKAESTSDLQSKSEVVQAFKTQDQPSDPQVHQPVHQVHQDPNLFHTFNQGLGILGLDCNYNRQLRLARRLCTLSERPRPPPKPPPKPPWPSTKDSYGWRLTLKQRLRIGEEDPTTASPSPPWRKKAWLKDLVEGYCCLGKRFSNFDLESRSISTGMKLMEAKP